MHIATLYNPSVVTGKLSVYTSIEAAKIRRYTLCLEMVKKILQDFYPARQMDTSLFRHLGEVACCIDTHLDDLSREQKEALLESFPSFFDSLGKDPDEDSFKVQLHSLCRRVNTTLYPPSWAIVLYRFYILCSHRGLLTELKLFSIKVIEAGILKSKAKAAKEILKSLEQEGSASICFLLELLQKEKVTDPGTGKYIRLRNYLSRLEKMLNIADDITDHKTDKCKGVINLNTGWDYHLTLYNKLLAVFFSTLINYPLFFTRHLFVFTYRYLRSELV